MYIPKEDPQTTQELKRQKAKEAEMKEFIDSFSSKEGKEKYKEVSKWVATGMFMGASDAIPGYSGGTTLALVGFFKKLVLVARGVFVPKYGITRMRALIFMLPFAAGWMAGVFGVAKATEALAVDAKMGLELLFFFSFFVIAAIPIYLRSIRNKPHSHKKKLSKKTQGIVMGVGATFVISLALVVLLVKGGATFDKEQVAGTTNKFELSNWWMLSIVAYAAGMITLIPGGSGAIIQLLSGMYDDIHWTIMAHASDNMLALFIFALSTFLGMVSMIFIMSWFLAKHERVLEMFSLGMLIASPIAILVVPEGVLWGHLKDWPHIVGVITAAGLGYGLGFGLNKFIKMKAKQ